MAHDPEHGLLAPLAELGANQPKSSLELLLEELEDVGVEAPATEISQPHTEAVVDINATASEDRNPCANRARRFIAQASRERMFGMSNFIPKQTNPKTSGLGPKAQKLAALREKAAQANTNETAATGASTSAAKPKNSFAGKKTAFQRKAT